MNKRNKVVIFSLIATLATGLAAGSVFAAWGVTDNANSFGVQIRIKANSCEVTFYTNYVGDEWANPVTVEVDSGEAIDAGDIPSVSMSGYSFEGWVNAVPSASNLESAVTNEQLTSNVISSDATYYPLLKSNEKQVLVNDNYYPVNEDVVLETNSIGQTLIGYQYVGVDGIPAPTSSWYDSRNLYTASGIYKFVEDTGAALIQRKIGFRTNTQWSQAWDNISCGIGIHSWFDTEHNDDEHMGTTNGYTLYTYIPADYNNFLFVRYTSNATAIDWDNKNQSADLSFSSSWSSGSYTKDSIVLEMNSWDTWIDGWGASSARWVENDEIQRDKTLDIQPVNDIHQTKQYNYLKDPDWTSINTYKPNLDNVDESKPRALELDFTGIESASTYYVQIGKNNDFSDAQVLTTTSNTLSWNPEIGTEYYYRIATSEAELENATVKQYYVANIMPRNLNLGGLRNVRDIGGWPTSLVPNGFVKQGLYYRGAQFNSGNYGANPTFSSSDLDEVHRLGIKVDIDMRNTNKQPTGNYSPASTDEYPITIVKATMPDGTESTRFSNFNTEWCNIFNAIYNADNEHVYLHCTYGADRTGIASFALLALLGVSVEDLGRDYEFTRLDGQRGVNHAENYAFDSWVTETNKLSGDTFADKMKTHLMNKGLSEHTLEHIREIFIDGYVAQA